MWLAGLIGYSVASIVYALFTMMLFTARAKSSVARWLLMCVLVMVGANGIAAAQMDMGFGLQWVMLIDAIKIACWSVLILSFNNEEQNALTLFKDKYIRRYLSIWLLAVFFCWFIGFWVVQTSEYIFLLFISLNLWVLVLLEQVFRSANTYLRWALWPLIIALASMAIFDFVLYAQAIMLKNIDFDFWYSRGVIALMALPLMVVTTRRIKEGAVRIFISRQVVFYSSMLMIAGVYLILMAATGYLLNYLGGEWGNMLRISFLVLSGVVLAVLLVTESLRKKVKVFITKNFFANKYEYRDEWLQLIDKIESASGDNYYQMATQIMMSKLNANAGVLIKRASQSQFTVQYSENIAFDESLNDDLLLLSEFCQKQGWIVDIDDYAQDPLSYPSLFIQPKTWQDKKLNIIVPILFNQAFYGVFILSTSANKEPLNWEDRDLLFAVAKQLGNFIFLHEANDKLAESKQFDAFSQMSAFLVHDLKNVQAQLELITSNAQKHRDNPVFIDDVFETVESATERLNKMLTQLRNKRVTPSDHRHVVLDDLIEKVVSQRNVQKPEVEFTILQRCSFTLEGEKFCSVMNHLIQNAQEASKAEAKVKVVLSEQDEQVKIEIIDTGCGMTEDFIRQRLFKPFDTTKGNAGMGIGVYDAKQFFEHLSGTITVKSTLGQGTAMIVTLPKSR